MPISPIESTSTIYFTESETLPKECRTRLSDLRLFGSLWHPVLSSWRLFKVEWNHWHVSPLSGESRHLRWWRLRLENKSVNTVCDLHTVSFIDDQWNQSERWSETVSTRKNYLGVAHQSGREEFLKESHRNRRWISPRQWPRWISSAWFQANTQSKNERRYRKSIA